jgi:hypothetical protein
VQPFARVDGHAALVDDRSADEVRLEHADRRIPGDVVRGLVRERVRVRLHVALQRRWKQGVDLVVGEVQLLALLRRKLDDDRPWASVDMDEPPVAIARDSFVVDDAELGDGLTLHGDRRVRKRGRCDTHRVVAADVRKERPFAGRGRSCPRVGMTGSTDSRTPGRP